MAHHLKTLSILPEKGGSIPTNSHLTVIPVASDSISSSGFHECTDICAENTPIYMKL